MATTTNFPTTGGGTTGLSTVNGLAKGDGAGNFTAAVEGVDFNVPISPAAISLYRARLILGNTLNTPLGTSFDTGAWWQALGTSGTVKPSVTLTGGAVVLDSTGTSGRSAIIAASAAASLVPSYVNNPRTERWYARYKFQCATAGDAQANMAPEIRASTTAGAPVIGFGFYGAISTTNFAWRSLDSGAATIASGTTGIAVDNAWHILEMWNDTTNLNFGLDLGLVSTTPTATTASTNIANTTPLTLSGVASNGSTNASRQLILQSMYWVAVVTGA